MGIHNKYEATCTCTTALVLLALICSNLQLISISTKRIETSITGVREELQTEMKCAKLDINLIVGKPKEQKS